MSYMGIVNLLFPQSLSLGAFPTLCEHFTVLGVILVFTLQQAMLGQPGSHSEENTAGSKAYI